ncbi:hypothetical protein Noda2021_10210 [Candidatus Dependentiae bacterium Noda2021]|nr:hypothetical protein Noda2021_10210 [Candidatus Dependentiae bacterium Noda2021]
MMIRRLLTIVLMVLLLPACGRRRYSTTNLKPVYKRSAHFQEKQSDVKIRVKKLNQTQTSKLFNGRGKRLKKSGIVPLQITVKNYSDTPLCLDRSGVDLPMVDCSVVAQKLYSSTTKKVAALTVVGLTCAALSFAGSCVCGLVGAMSGIPFFIGASYGTGVLSGVFLMGTPVVTYIQAKDSQVSNREIAHDIHQKTVINSLSIDSNQEKTWLIFVKEKDLARQFNITFKHDSRNDTRFKVLIS